MAFCDSCGGEVSDGVWVCGRCGAPMKPAEPVAASDTTNPYVFSAQAQAEPALQPPRPFTPAPAKPATGNATIVGLTKLTFAVLAVAVVAVGCLAVWFVFFNNGDGTKYLGTWEPTTSVSAASGGVVGDGGRLMVAASGGSYTVTLIDGKGQSLGPLKASLKRGKLVFGLEYAGNDETQQLKLQLVKAFVGMLYKDYHATLSPGAGGTIYLSQSAKVESDLLKQGMRAIQLRRVSP